MGDLDQYHVQETMDQSIPFSRAYASDSDDDGPDEEVDEEGFMPKEAQAFKKLFGRDHKTPLFKDLSLADEAVVDGGKCISLEVGQVLTVIWKTARTGYIPVVSFNPSWN